MKRAVYFLLIACILFSALAIFTKPIILFVAQRQLNNIFFNSMVKIGACDLKSLRQLSLLNIEIKKEPLYAFGAGQISFDFTLFSILRGRILKITFQDAVASINFGQKSILEFSKQLNLGSAKAPFRIDCLELTNLFLNLNSKEVNIKARFSSGIDLLKQEINYADLELDSLDSFGIIIENANLKAAQIPAIGTLNIAKVKYDKAVINQIKANVRLEGSSLTFDTFSARIFDGEVRGNLSFKLDKEGVYRADLEFIGLDPEAFVKDFKLEEKFNLSGKISGAVKLAGRGPDIKIIAGNLKASPLGGMLTITDTGYLEKLARDSGESLNILVESLKNYHYNNGRLNLSLEQGNLIFDAALEGEAGKRNLIVVLHDFNLRGRD
jgi:hypothetical protein